MRRAALLLLPLLTAAAPADWDARFKDIYTAEYQWRLASFAEREGSGQDRIMSPHLPDVSPAAQAGRAAMWTKVEAQLAEIPRDQLSPENQTNFAVYRGQIDAMLAEQRFKEWQKPANSDSSFWGDLSSADEKPLRSDQEYRNYLAKLSEVPRYFDQQIANMKAGEARGFTPPQVTLEGRDQIHLQHRAMPSRLRTHRLLGKPFKTMTATIAPDAAGGVARGSASRRHP